jgi:hypothetical protein
MRRIALPLIAAAAAVCLPLIGADATPPVSDKVNVDEIIRKFAEKETEFTKARAENYTYHQISKLQEMDSSGNPTGGEWYEEVDVLLLTESARKK